MPVDSSSWLWTMTRTLSPSVTRSTGPGTHAVEADRLDRRLLGVDLPVERGAGQLEDLRRAIHRRRERLVADLAGLLGKALEDRLRHGVHVVHAG